MGENFHEFCGFEAIRESFNREIFIEYEGIIINGRVIILGNGDSGRIMGVGSWVLPPSRSQCSICPTVASQTATRTW